MSLPAGDHWLDLVTELTKSTFLLLMVERKDIPAGLLGATVEPHRFFAVKISAQSMIEAGLLPPSPELSEAPPVRKQRKKIERAATSETKENWADVTFHKTGSRRHGEETKNYLARLRPNVPQGVKLPSDIEGALRKQIQRREAKQNRRVKK